jgi:hypothetical protein
LTLCLRSVATKLSILSEQMTQTSLIGSKGRVDGSAAARLAGAAEEDDGEAAEEDAGVCALLPAMKLARSKEVFLFITYTLLLC